MPTRKMSQRERFIHGHRGSAMTVNVKEGENVEAQRSDTKESQDGRRLDLSLALPLPWLLCQQRPTQCLLHLPTLYYFSQKNNNQKTTKQKNQSILLHKSTRNRFQYQMGNMGRWGEPSAWNYLASVGFSSATHS